MNTILERLDNPIFVKHLRSRLRKSQFTSSAVVVLVLCLLDAYAGWWQNWYSNNWAYSLLFGLQTILIAFIGGSQVGTAVGSARESGILDFHRVSPVSPLSATLGFFFGAPIREYALLGLTLPFALACVYFGPLSLFDWFQSLASLILVGWLIQSFAIMVALMAKKPKSAGGMVVGLLIFFTYACFGIGAGVMRGPGGSRLDPSLIRFFGAEVPWLGMVALYLLPPIFFFLLASTRKMHSDRAHPYAKRDAIAFLAVEAMVLIGGGWNFPGVPVVVFVVLYALVTLGCILATAITPNLGEFAKGVRRARKQGGTHLSFWDDRSLNRIALCVLCLVVLVGATLSWTLIAALTLPPGVLSPYWYETKFSYGIPIATGVLVVAYFGLALQYFLLMAPRRGKTILGLFLFFVWIVPMVIAGCIGIASGPTGPTDTTNVIAALSPITGLVLSSYTGQNSFWVGAAAIVPALIFTLLFNNLVTSARRRVINAIDAGRDGVKPSPIPDPLAEDEPALIRV